MREGRPASNPSVNDMQAEIVGVSTFCLFHSYFRLQAVLRLGGWAAKEVFPRLIVGQLWVERRAQVRHIPEQDAIEVTLEALVDRALFPDQAVLEIACDGSMASLPATALMEAASAAQGGSLDGAFRDIIEDMRRANPAVRPRMLDIGGRARSGIERRRFFPQCDVTTFDIIADPSVDVVGDAHELSRSFAPDSFDLVLCVSVFEHLLMPWKATLEMNAVLRPGGVALIHTHQTIGMHDLPWDFWRFSDTCWQGLFNRHTGFEILRTSLQDFMQVVPRAWNSRYSLAEHSGGFEGSTVIVRKIGATRLRWDAPLSDVLATNYPTQA